MPLYEYLCDACGHRFEKIQKFSDPLIEECPNCGAKQVHKLVSSPAIQFKGTGWYITDYAKKGTVDASKSGDSKDGNSAGGDAKSESKETAKAGDSKSGDSKSSESKSPETKSSDSKSSDTKTTTSSSS